jgi:hypothetical protein
LMWCTRPMSVWKATTCLTDVSLTSLTGRTVAPSQDNNAWSALEITLYACMIKYRGVFSACFQ